MSYIIKGKFLAVLSKWFVFLS